MQKITQSYDFLFCPYGMVSQWMGIQWVAGIHHSKYWMLIHYDTIKDGQNKKSHLLFSNWVLKVPWRWEAFQLWLTDLNHDPQFRYKLTSGSQTQKSLIVRAVSIFFPQHYTKEI